MSDSKQQEATSKFTNKFNFCIDRGGTFTDVYCEIPSEYCAKNHGSPYTVTKLLSKDPSYEDAPREGIRRILHQFLGKDARTNENKVNSSQIGYIRMGTTVATNALLERKGEKTALIITKGFKLSDETITLHFFVLLLCLCRFARTLFIINCCFQLTKFTLFYCVTNAKNKNKRDLLEIGNQSRPNIFDLNIRRPEMLYSKVYEINERILIYDERVKNPWNLPEIIGSDGQKLLLEIEPSKDEVVSILKDISKHNIHSIAIACLHSYSYNKHELFIKNIALSLQKECGFKNISLSSELMPMVKIVPRGHTVE